MLATLVVAAAMGLGAVLLVSVYRNQLISSLDQTLQQQVTDRAALIDDGNDPQSLVSVVQEESLVWIGTPAGSAIAVSGAVQPVDNPVPKLIGEVGAAELLVIENKPNEVEREVMDLRLASAATADGALVVVAAAEVEVVDKAVGGLARVFLLGLPPLLALVAGLTWFTTGRALKPVHRITSRASEVSGSNLSGRVAVPDTGDEIEDLAVTVNAMLDRIEFHNYSLRQFTADASHELKSPVANLRALVDTARIDDPSWSALHDQLAGESDRLRNLVDNLLFMASHEAGRPPERREAIALDELLFAEAELVAATGDVTVDLTGVWPVTVTGSLTDLGRLVRNLVDNAVRHAKTTVALAIETPSVGSTPGAITLIVGDDGPGVPTADQERIFERFTRLDEARARGDGGSGLGLSIVRQIAVSHGGTVSVCRSPLGGAEFRVRFESALNGS